MSAGFDLLFSGEGGIQTNRCSIVSLYEDAAGLETLMRLCNSLSWKFKDEMEFDFDWWRFKYLSDPAMGLQAAHNAAKADLILLAPREQELPKYVQGWFDGWLPSRTSGEGVLVLVEPGDKEKPDRMSLGSYLKQTARRGNLDYLTLEPPRKKKAFSLAQPELRDLLYPGGQPMHWGINE